MFTACRPGFYKAFAGNTKCSKCPPHSLTHVEATSVCQCEKSYFRAEKDPPSMACTSKSVHFAFENFISNPFGLFILKFLKKEVDIQNSVSSMLLVFDNSQGKVSLS